MPVSHLQRSVAAAAQKIRQSWSSDEAARRHRQAHVMQHMLLRRLGWVPVLASQQARLVEKAG